MRSLIERSGGVPLLAPSMREIPLTENADAIDAIQQVMAGKVSYLVLLTGVGTEAMLGVAAAHGLEADLLQSMGRMALLVRGPKPAAVLSRYGLKYTVKAPEPNTWKQLLTAIDEAQIELSGQTVGVQEYGIPNPELCAGLTARGASVLPIPVYRWALPEDTEPLKRAVRQTIAGEIDALLFTSAQQVRHVLQIAEQLDGRAAWLQAANHIVVGSIGPTCSQTLDEVGLTVSVEASPPKMGPLVRRTMQHLAGR